MPNFRLIDTDSHNHPDILPHLKSSYQIRKRCPSMTERKKEEWMERRSYQKSDYLDYFRLNRFNLANNSFKTWKPILDENGTNGIRLLNLLINRDSSSQNFTQFLTLFRISRTNSIREVAPGRQSLRLEFFNMFIRV